MDRSTSINFIPQPYLSKQCGQTCLAMITGKSIEDICKEIGSIYTTNIYNDLQKYLNKKDYKTVVVFGDLTMEEVPNNSIIRLSKPCGGGHFVLKSDNEILDPSIGKIKEYLNEYKISHYLKFEEKQ